MPRFALIREKIVDAFSGPPVVFHHIPKCGGTSIGKALRRRYSLSSARLPVVPAFLSVSAQHPNLRLSETASKVDEFFHLQLLRYLHANVRCVVGHVRFSNVAYQHFSEKYHFITALREPVALMLSHFYFQEKRPANIWPPEKNLDRYLDSDAAREFGGILPYYLSGLPTNIDRHSPESLEKAKANLGKFSAIGFVEDMTSFERKLSEIVGIRLRIGHANRTADRRAAHIEAITPEIRRKMEALSASNIELYEFAKRQAAS